MTSNDFPKMKTGDRVYTYKRGFGQIVGCSTIRNRPWIISFDLYPDKAFWPKEKNILPEYAGKFIEEIDRKCVEELIKQPGACTADQIIRKGKEIWEKLLAWSDATKVQFLPNVGDVVFYDSPSGIKKWTVERISHDLVWNKTRCDLTSFDKGWKAAVSIEEIRHWRESDEEKYCQPKIKVGDLVFYDGLYAHHGIKKWVCAGRKVGVYHEPDTYELKEAGPHGSIVINIPTSEVLRPWKETKFTAFVGIHEPSTLKVSGLCDGNLTPNDYKQVVYLGKNAIGIDTFSCTTFDGCITILFGEKGDDL